MTCLRNVVLLALGLAASACSGAVVQKEDMLSASGFQYRPADTPQRIAALQKLPAHRFVRQVRNGTVQKLGGLRRLGPVQP